MASRRRRSAASSSSTCDAGTPTVASWAFTRSGSARMRRVSSTSRLTRRVGCAAQMVEGRRLAVEPDADDVEADVAVREAARGQEVARDARHARLLAGVDRFEGGADEVASPAPHLDEDQRGPVEGNQVDLAGPAA